MSDLGVRVERDGASVRLELDGELDLATAERAQAAVVAALDPLPERLQIVLAGMRFIDSHGIWLVVESHRRAVRQGFALEVHAGSSSVARALELAGLEHLVTERSGAPAGAQPVALELYVSGGAGRSMRAVGAARRLVERLGPERAALEVVDVLAEPRRAEAARIIATPTLVRSSPPPPAKLIGDLDGPEELAAHLGLGTLLDGDGA